MSICTHAQKTLCSPHPSVSSRNSSDNTTLLSLSLSLSFSSRNSNNRVCTQCYIHGAMQFGSLERENAYREKGSGCTSLTTKPDKRARGFGNRCETMSIRAWHAGKGSGKWLTYFPRWIHPLWRRAKDWIGYSHKASHHSVSPRLSRACREWGRRRRAIFCP